MVVAVLRARPRLTDPRQQAAGQVVADRARRDPGQVGQFGERVANVSGMALYCQCDVPLSSPRLSAPPPYPLHTAARRWGQTGSEVDPRSPAQGVHHHMSRTFAAIVLIVVIAHRRRDRRHHRLPGGPVHGRHAGRRRRRHRRQPGRRARLRLRLGLGPRLRLRVLRLPVRDALLPVHRVRADPGAHLGRPRVAAATGAVRAGIPRRAGRTSRPASTARSRTGTARPTTRPPSRRRRPTRRPRTPPTG